MVGYPLLCNDKQLFLFPGESAMMDGRRLVFGVIDQPVATLFESILDDVYSRKLFWRWGLCRRSFYRGGIP